MLIDTHSHIYLEEFDTDCEAVIKRATEANINKLLFPNVDFTTFDRMMRLYETDTKSFSVMMGLHPTSVELDYKKQLNLVAAQLEKNIWCAIGEIGLDFYWDRTFEKQQKEVFTTQIQWAMELALPVAIHNREASDAIFEILDKKQDGRLTGVWHCFSGTLQQAQHAIELGLMLGIGGVLTYKNSVQLCQTVAQIPLNHFLLETDSPYLPPVPYRGKRNEPSYMVETAKKLAQLKSITFDEVADTTTQNAISLFNLQKNNQL